MELKNALSDPEFLAAPVRGAPKKVMTDASGYGLGGVLLQMNADGKWQPISFTSRLLRKSERNYAPTERECLEILHALQKWRHYLHGESFVAETDHLALKWLLSLRDPREKLARWVVEVQDCDFSVEYWSGPELVVPAALSRDAVPKPLCKRCYCPLSDATLERHNREMEGEQGTAIIESFIRTESVRAVERAAIVANGLTSGDLRTA